MSETTQVVLISSFIMTFAVCLILLSIVAITLLFFPRFRKYATYFLGGLAGCTLGFSFFHIYPLTSSWYFYHFIKWTMSILPEVLKPAFIKLMSIITPVFMPGLLTVIFVNFVVGSLLGVGCVYIIRNRIRGQTSRG